MTSQFWWIPTTVARRRSHEVLWDSAEYRSEFADLAFALDNDTQVVLKHFAVTERSSTITGFDGSAWHDTRVHVCETAYCRLLRYDWLAVSVTLTDTYR